MPNWILALDESGKLDDPKSPALLGGVLVNLVDDPVRRAAMRARIVAALPGVPWPPHATDLNLLGARVVYATNGVSGASEHAELASRQLGLGSGIDTGQSTLEVIGREIRARLDGRLIHELENDVVRGRVAMKEVLADLAKTTLAPGAAWVVGSWERRGLAGENGADRYARLFESLAARVELILERSQCLPGERHDVVCRSARYDDRNKVVTNAVLARLVNVQPAVGVRWTITKPQSYRSNETHPALVLADFACNRLFRPINRVTERNGSWVTLADEVSGSTGVMPLAATGVDRRSGAPTIAPLGVPDTVVRKRAHALGLSRAPEEGASPASPDALVGFKPAWAAEQATVWLSLLGS